MSTDTIEKLLILGLGWLLGLLGPVIVDGIKRRRENALGQAAIVAELRDVAHKLALAAHYIHMHRGTVSRPHLEWLKQHIEGHAGLVDVDDLLKSVRTQLSWSDEELQKYVKATAAASTKGMVLQKYPVPMLDSRVSAMWSFDTEVQRRLLDVRTRLALLNDLVERSIKQADMTFGKLDDNNHRLIVENIEQSYELYADGAKRVVQVVDELKYLP